MILNMIYSDHKKKYIRANEISVCLSRDNAILYNPSTNQKKTINPTAFFIWKRLDGIHTIDDISKSIMEHFESAPHGEIFQDVCDFLSELYDQKYIEQSDNRSVIELQGEYPNIHDRPGEFDISLTGKCNLHCDYCFYAKEMKTRSDLPKEEWFTFFDELGSLAVRNLTLSGGEIFVRTDLWELIDHLIYNRMRYSILTNGTLITKKTLSFFEKGKRRQRLNSIQVSIDGSCPEIHDKSRGNGSFKRAIRGLRLLKEAGFPVTCRVTVNRFNVDDLENIACLFARRHRPRQFRNE